MKRKPAESTRTTTSATPADAVRFFQEELRHWWLASGRDFPWRRTSDVFAVLVAEVLLQRSRASTVAPIFERFVERWPTAILLARADLSEIQKVIRPLGLVGRAERLRRIASALAERRTSPTTYEDLISLPGVGPYTAGATLAVISGEASAVSDGVSARVYQRFFGIDTSNLKPVVASATPITGEAWWNWAVLDLAAAICLPRRPKCASCPLARRCAGKPQITE